MDILSFLIPRPIFINKLPSIYFLTIPLDIVVYFLAGLLIIILVLKAEKKFTEAILLGGWLILSLLYLVQSGIQTYTENLLFGNKSLDELREMTTSNNFYSFLQFALKSVPEKEPVTLYLPENSNYFKQKAPYFIYPHLITNDASYILIFKNDNVKLNKQVQLLVEYKPGMYLFKKN